MGKKPRIVDDSRTAYDYNVPVRQTPHHLPPRERRRRRKAWEERMETHSTKHVTYEALVERLCIGSLLPSGIDHDHAAAIILVGCVRPGQRWGRVVNKLYRKAESIRRSVASKLTSSFSQERYDTALAWLLEHDVLLLKKDNHINKPCYSLNPHEASASSDGAPCVRRILAFMHELHDEFMR